MLEAGRITKIIFQLNNARAGSRVQINKVPKYFIYQGRSKPLVNQLAALLKLSFQKEENACIELITAHGY